MEKFDLTVFETGLEKGVFVSIDVMNLIYGSMQNQKEQGGVVRLVWHVKRFNGLPIQLREQLVKLMIEQEQKYPLFMMQGIHDVANTRAVCALNAVLHKGNGSSDISRVRYSANFDAQISPALGVQEIVNWAKWGVQLRDDVYQLAQYVLARFLEDAPQGSNERKRVLLKKRQLVLKRNNLHARVASLMNKSNTIDALLMPMKHQSQNFREDAVNLQLKHQEIQRDIEQNIVLLSEIYHLLGQAEAYRVVQMQYID